MRAKCVLARGNVAALWMIGFEDEPEKSAEICIFELKGNNIEEDGSARIGYGIRKFADPAVMDDFREERFAIDTREDNIYAAEWTDSCVSFFVNGELTHKTEQAPRYGMQLMLNIYELEGRDEGGAFFSVDYIAGYGLRG